MKTLPLVDFQAVAAEGSYVYCYLRASRATPYYIGVGTRAVRPFQVHGVKVPTDRSRVRVLRAGLTRDEALEWERFYIRHYGRVDLGTGVLRNLTDGGDGGSGARPSQQTREKMSRASLGKPKSPKHRAAIKRGRSELTPAQLANYSAGNSRPASEDKKQAISSSLRARHLEKLAKLGLTEEEYAELQKRRKAERRKELRLQKQAAQGRYQQSEEARENYRRAAIEREAKKRLTRLAAA